ncbi:MAG: NAD-dependent epimerase/dehydratase family protein [Candidatus Omnitrophica bacterium]|nr:NAD-dependent epimerase/dehydratase family protein [Candidatus Omnitrophota bacterium]
MEYYKDKTILVTGAAGYLGTSLLHALAGQSCKILGVDRAGAQWTLPAHSKAAIETFERDIKDPDFWDEWIPKAEIIYHFAAQTSVYVANEDPVADYAINVLPVVHYVQSSTQLKKKVPFLFSSTATVVGVTDSFPIDETHHEDPVTVYDLHKLTAEKYLKYDQKTRGGKGVVLRLANVYGPGVRGSQLDRGITNLMVQRALRGEEMTVYGEGGYVRDYVYIDDIIQAFLLAGQYHQRLHGGHFLIGRGEGFTFLEMMELIKVLVERDTHRDVSIKQVAPPEHLSPIEFRHFVADHRLFMFKTAWEPAVSLEDGLKRTIHYYANLANGTNK